MSLGARGGAKGGAKGGSGKDRHGDKKEKPQPKEKVKPQATTEQIRMANMIDRKTTDDGADVRKMVQDLMEMTCRTEEEVCSALHDADNDVVGACNILLETQKQSEWQTSEKKKKKPPQPVNNGEGAPPRERERGPGAQARPRRGDGPGGRGSTRGGRGGRGFGRGGARGARAPPRPRPDQQQWQPNQYNDANQMGDAFPAPEDWDNEEWSGSLSDTKVFTPSTAAAPEAESVLPPNATEEWEGGTDPHAIPSYTYHNAQQHHVNIEQLNSVSRASPSTPELPSDHYLQQLASQIHAPQPMGMSGSLSAAQTQYLSQLTQQTQRHDPSVYSSNYGVYGAADISSQRKPQQRARVPPPSKIPMSAVEMPGGMGEGGMFLDVQFGALEPDESPPAPLPQATLEHKHTQQTPPHAVNHVAPEPAAEPAPPALPYPHPAPAQHPQHPQHQTHQTHQTHQPLQLNESLTSVEATPPSSQPPAPASDPPQTTNATTSLDAALSGAMKQLAVSAAESAPLAHQPYVSQHRPKQSSASVAAGAAGAAQNVYAHHPVPHHPPPVYGANVYAPQQVNSSNASLSAAAAGMSSGYPSSAALTQYQPILNSYQTSSSPAAYSSAALYTAAAAPYSYQPAPQPHHNNKHKETTHQYEASSVSVSNSLSSTSTTQTSTAKVVTTTASHTAASGTNSANAGAAASAAGGAYAGGALYGSQGYAYDEQMMRSTMPHHMGGYYEVGYGVSGAREGAFGLGAGERFGRADAASPQQVPAAALPPGYAYFYQPPPTTYQYGVYPTYGGGSSVGGVSGGGKVGNYAQQQPQYEQQDTYKPGGGYGGSAAKAGGAANADLNSAMYAKTHVALNKVNSYEKAGFHSGTPPPFGAASHLYIPAPPHHHHHHQQESGTTGGRASTNKAAHSKPTYSHSYWPPN